MYIDVVPNRKSPPAVLLREAHRQGKRTIKRTIANLSDWPQDRVDMLRRLLAGERLVSAKEVFVVEKTTPHGHVEAIMAMIRKLGLDDIIASKPCRERNLVLAMIAERLLYPCSKLATTRVWHMTTLAQELQVHDADEDELYDALDWLLERQERIENKLASRHLAEGCQIFYDVSSSYYEGKVCVLARRGYCRDGKQGMAIIVYGVMTDAEGRPIAVKVYEGNTGDPSTVPDQVQTLRERFGLNRVVLVGDRGMLTQTQIDLLRQYPQLGWISALRTEAIRSLYNAGSIQMSLFDKQNLAEIVSDDFPGERLMVCFNSRLADERRRTRDELLGETDKLLCKLSLEVQRRKKKMLTAAEIGIKLGRIRGKYKMGKHYTFEISDGRFKWQRNQQSIDEEKCLDGIYIVRTSEKPHQLSCEDTVRSYKRLSQVERAFRTLKSMDIRIRPIRHWNNDHVKAHIFLCMLSYYVEWHLRKAWSPLLFDDEQLDAERAKRDPVLPATSSASAKVKKSKRQTSDGLPIQSFDTLLKTLGTRTRNMCRVTTSDNSFEQVTPPDALQSRALELLKMHPVNGNAKTA